MLRSKGSYASTVWMPPNACSLAARTAAVSGTGEQQHYGPIDEVAPQLQAFVYAGGGAERSVDPDILLLDGTDQTNVNHLET